MTGPGPAAGRAAALARLEARLTRCRRCPRLVAHREQVARQRRRAFREQEYWGRPVPAFGGAGARLVIVGLAPAAHGANRTGRMFTGDRSGDWLYDALFAHGFASRAESCARDDGLALRDAFVTAGARCAPPGNHPTPGEFANCRPWLVAELALLARARVVVALGALAWEQWWRAWAAAGGAVPAPRPRFAHGAERAADGVRGGAGDGAPLTVLGSYHPSQQNTQTGRLTRPMLYSVFARARALLDDATAPAGSRSRPRAAATRRRTRSTSTG